MQKASVREARQYISRLLDAVAKGEEVVITRRGKPIARLVPVSNGETRLIQFPDRGPFRAKIPPAVKPSSDLVREMRDDRG